MRQPRLLQVLEFVIGLAPATFILLPLLLAGGLGTALAAFARRSVDLDTALHLGWVAAATFGLGTLWILVLRDRGSGLSLPARVLSTAGLLLGMGAAARWIWFMAKAGHAYEASTWIVWGLLTGGPLLVAAARLVGLWAGTRRDS